MSVAAAAAAAVDAAIKNSRNWGVGVENTGHTA